MKTVKIANKTIGSNNPCFIIAEIGINHNGDINLAKQLIDIASSAGCDAVKFQKRTVEKVYSKEELSMPRDSVFGTTNGDLKRGLEFNFEQYTEIDNYCNEKDILWFASPWDVDSVDFLEQFNVPCHKIASACLTDKELLEKVRATKKPIILSTGMSTMDEIDSAIDFLKGSEIILLHCTSTYPTAQNEINLNVIPELINRFKLPVGFSGHEKGITPSILSTVLGACVIERHITIDRTLWGSDQAASLEPRGLTLLVRDIRQAPVVLGDGIKKVYNSEIPIKNKLRKNIVPVK